MMKKKFLGLCFLMALVLFNFPVNPALAAKVLVIDSSAGSTLLAGESACLTASLGGQRVNCKWEIQDEKIAKIISGSNNSEVTLQTLAPGQADICVTTEDGLFTNRYTISVAPAFTVMTAEGMPLSWQEYGSQKWLLVPENQDSIKLCLRNSGQVLDYYTQTALEPAAGGNDYILTLKKTKLSDQNLTAFLKKLDGNLLVDEKKDTGFAKYATGAYSVISVKGSDGTEVELNICWQVAMPHLTSLMAQGAVFYTPFAVTDFTQQFVLNKKCSRAVFSFIPSGNTVQAYLQDADGQTINNAVSQKDGVYSFSVKKTDFAGAATVTRYLVLEDSSGYKEIITFTGAQRLVDSPDKIVDYLCLGSQYSDGGNQLTGIYGLYPEKSLIGNGYWWSPISLGNFGGYITYYYSEGIKNDPYNPYGIDFIVYGNSNGGSGFSEPGNVIVSEDGKTWYNLAGSDHYENSTKWHYQVTYTREQDGSTSANGINMSYYMYVSPGNYPLHDWLGEKQGSITVSGVLLPFSSSGNAAFPAFGYADVHTNSSTAWGTGEIVTVSGQAGNPYLPVTTRVSGLNQPEGVEALYEGFGDGFDLEWAVDKQGLPVDLAEIHYIKVQNASLTTVCGGIGEKSTEVNVITPALAGSSLVGVSEAPAGISVDGTPLFLQDGVYTYETTVQGSFTVEVEAGDTANVYINNLRGNSRYFMVTPAQGIIRVIVQEGEKEPLIYYLKVIGDPFTEQDVEAGVSAALQQSGVTSAVGHISRAVLASTLYNLAGEPDVDRDELKKMPAGAWYAEAMAWASGAGIIKGTEAGFVPDEYLTRQQAATVLYRYAAVLGRSTPASESVTASDNQNISAWAADAMNWAASKDIINSDNSNAVKPSGGINQAELAEILESFFAAMVK